MHKSTIVVAVIVAIVMAGLWALTSEDVIRVEVGPTPTASPTATLVPTQTPLPTYTQPATSTPTATSTATPTPSPTASPQPTWTPYPTYTPGPDPEAMFLDGLYAMCLAGNGYMLEHLFFMPFDCADIITGADEGDWYLDDDFHRDRPTTTPTLPPVYRPGTDPLRDTDGPA